MSKALSLASSRTRADVVVGYLINNLVALCMGGCLDENGTQLTHATMHTNTPTDTEHVSKEGPFALPPLAFNNTLRMKARKTPFLPSPACLKRVECEIWFVLIFHGTTKRIMNGCVYVCVHQQQHMCRASLIMMIDRVLDGATVG